MRAKLRAGDQYTGLDRFGRVVDQRWLNSSNASVDRYQYTYDRNSNRTSKVNVLNGSFTEVYTYDGLNRLVDVQRGSAAYQSWVLDALGNMNSVTTNSTTETRTHNSANQLTGMGSNTLTFDNNGNTTTDDYGRTLKYDAWNRLVEYNDGGSLTVAYSYDGLNRRITQDQPAEDPRDFYYSANWQIVEERLGSTTDAQYVWSPVYVDAMVFRDKDTNVGNIRSFAMQDANFSATRVLTLIESTSTWIADHRSHARELSRSNLDSIYRIGPIKTESSVTI